MRDFDWWNAASDAERMTEFFALAAQLAETEARADRDVIVRNRVIAEKSARLAEAEALLRDSEALLCDPRAGVAGNETAARLRAFLAQENERE